MATQYDFIAVSSQGGGGRRVSRLAHDSRVRKGVKSSVRKQYRRCSARRGFGEGAARKETRVLDAR